MVKLNTGLKIASLCQLAQTEMKALERKECEISTTRLEFGKSRMQLRHRASLLALAQERVPIIGHVLVNLLEHFIGWIRQPGVKDLKAHLQPSANRYFVAYIDVTQLLELLSVPMNLFLNIALDRRNLRAC